MQQRGSSKNEVFAELKKLRLLDQRYREGKILCSMCTQPHPLAEKAHRMFCGSNLGDPGLFQGSATVEKEVIAHLAELLHGKNASGFVVSGGTEANLLALLAARNKANIEQPEVVLPESAHFSLTKSCSLLKIKPIYAKLATDYKVDPKDVEEKLSKNTIAVVGTAGTAELGVIDPIDELSDIALRHSVWLHVDAAFGGLVIPFLNNDKQRFDFQLAAVKSMTVDPHKMGMATIPAGGILFRETTLLDYVKTDTPYLTDTVQYTFVGTRTGASAASAWAVFKALGMDGLKEIVGECMRTTQILEHKLEISGFQVVTKPTLNMLAFRSKNTKRLAEKLCQKGWFVSYIPRYDCIRIVVMPHVKRRHATAFLKALQEIENL